MIGQQIKTIDLIEIANAAKAFKQRDVILYNNRLCGLDNIKVYVIHTSPLQLSRLYPTMFFNYRELSAFLKNITAEEYFTIDSEYKIHTQFRAVDDKMVDTLCLYCDRKLESLVQSKERFVSDLLMYNEFLYEQSLDVTEELSNLFSLRKTDGTIYYNKKCNGRNYFMTLFSGLIPLNKADKIYLNLIDNGSNTFIANLSVHKKNIKIISYISYLKV